MGPVTKERFVVDQNGQRVAVLLDIEDYRQLLEELEELESMRAYDDAKASGSDAIPFDQATDEIERDMEPYRAAQSSATRAN